MFKNIFQINPTNMKPIDRITSQVKKVLLLNQNSLSTLEIQFKYAKCIEFDPFSKNVEDYFYNDDQNIRKKAQTLYDKVYYSSIAHQQSLKIISNQGLILLNGLGKRMYKVKAQFDQAQFKCFYHIKQFFLKLCKFNLEKKVFEVSHVYQNISKISENRFFKLYKDNQIRLDIIVMNQNEELNGRYTYQIGSQTPWTKINKNSQVKQQFDLMLSQKIFRLGLNQQKQGNVSYETLNKLSNFLQKQKPHLKNYMVRIKRATRVLKNDMIQFSLSQVYQTNKPQEDLPQLSKYILSDGDERDNFIMDKFCKFYDRNQGQSKWQIEAQFTKKGIQKLYQMAKKNRFQALKGELQIVLQDLYALFYAEHAVKTRQVQLIKSIINRIDNNGKIQVIGRLDNQYGSYMRDLLYQIMQQNQKK